MTQIGFTGNKIVESLSDQQVRKGGLIHIHLPIIKCILDDTGNHLEIGGYKSFIFYNKKSEKQYASDKLERRFRTVKRQLKRLASRNCYEDFPSPDKDISTTAEAPK